MKLDQLPVEMLMEVFSYVPMCGEVELVNKLFHGVCGKVNDRKVCLKIDRPFSEHFLSDDKTCSQYLRSMQMSNHQISKVEFKSKSRNDRFLMDHSRWIISVIESFAMTITSLKFTGGTTDECTLLQILSLTPNVERLDLSHLHINMGQSSKRQRYMQFTKLKSLSIYTRGKNIARFVERLPVGVVTELGIQDHFSWYTLALKRQPNIKCLEVGGAEIEDDKWNDAYILGKLELTSLDLTNLVIDSDTLVAILAKQPKLKSLTLCRYADERVMNAVADLTELEVFNTIGCTVLPPFVPLKRILKLKNLKALSLKCEGTAMLETVAKSNNTTIEKLTLHACLTWPIDLAGALAKSVSHLKHLKIRSSSAKSGELEKVMRHFNFIECLDIHTTKGSFVGHESCFNPKMRELTIRNSDRCCDPLLTKLIALYPNLKKLRLLHHHEFPALQIKSILNGFKKLESLTIHGPQPIVGDLDSLHEHENNLKFVSLRYMNNGALTDELRKKLRLQFGVIDVARDGSLNMAVDRYTLYEEFSLFYI